MPVSDSDAALISSLLPDNSWLKVYVEHACSKTSAPRIYHYGMGLTVLGATAPSDLSINYAVPLHANNYCLVVGRSGHEQKSTALHIGRSILEEASSNLVCGSAASKEGLFDSLAANPRQFVSYSEFGDLLASTKQGYAQTMKTFLTDAWDGFKMDRLKAKNKENQGKVLTVTKPRLSVGAACSFGFLETHSLAEDWSGGFYARWLVLLGTRERTIAIPQDDPISGRRDWLVNELRIRATMSNMNDQPGGPAPATCVGWDTAAEKLWTTWYHGLAHRPLTAKIEGITTRAPALVLRCALSLAWDYGPAAHNPGKPFLMTTDLLIPAMAIVEYHLRSLNDLAEVLAEHSTARLRRDVYRVIANLPQQSATLGDITRTLKLKKRDVLEVLDTLVAEGQLAALPGQGSTLYVIA
jgi:hypothetical protein